MALCHVVSPSDGSERDKLLFFKKHEESMLQLDGKIDENEYPSRAAGVRSPCVITQGKHPTTAGYATSFAFFWVLHEWEGVGGGFWVLETCLWVL